MLQNEIVQTLQQMLPQTAPIKSLIKRIRAATVLEPGPPRYRCPECQAVLEEGERRCGDCNKFGSRLNVLLDCPHCSEPITEEDM